MLEIMKELFRNKRLILDLAKNDFRTKYAGSYLGITWAFTQPVITILIYWFVFQIGFRSGSVDGLPFVLWLIAGITPWFFFSDALMSATGSLFEYSYLVKKVLFKVSILPIVKTLSSLFVHVFFVCLCVLVFCLNGYKPTIHWFQLIYYSICTFIYVLSLSYITASIFVFFKDIGQIINIVLQFFMWLTPIMWNYTMVPERHRWILKLNPLYYIVEGYRGAIIRQEWFWRNNHQTLYFWLLTLSTLVFGTMIYKKLRVHFADVL